MLKIAINPRNSRKGVSSVIVVLFVYSGAYMLVFKEITLDHLQWSLPRLSSRMGGNVGLDSAPTLQAFVCLTVTFEVESRHFTLFRSKLNDK
jgi:hypothetical protein